MVFGLFSKERALERTVKKATNKLAQSQERWAALEKLRDIGTDEALYHLLRRFSFASLKGVEDEQEKAWVVQVMVGLGERSLGPLRRYMKSSTAAIAYPLRILEDVASREQALALIDEILADEPPGYTKDTSKRIQIIDWLAEWRNGTDDDMVARVVPYLADFDENVRFATVEALSLRCTEAAAEPLIDALLNEEEESGRFKARIVEVLHDQNLPLGERKKQIGKVLPDIDDEFRLQRDKIVRKKKPK